MPTLFTPEFVRFLNAKAFSTKGWVTLSSKDKEGEKHGSTHVYIDGSGTITKGPAHMTGKKPSELKTHKVTAEHGENHPETGTPEGPKKNPEQSEKHPLNPTEESRKINPVETPKQETKMQAETIVKKTSIRDVDAYRPGGVLKVGGEYRIVTAAKVRRDDHGSYEHTITTRPASEDESRRARVGAIKHELSSMVAGPSDDRDRPAHDTRANELRGELARLEAPDKERAAKEILTAPPVKRFSAAVAMVKARAGINNRGDIADSLGIEWERFLELEDGATPTADELAKIDAVLKGGGK